MSALGLSSNFALSLVTAPVRLPLTLAELRAHLRVDREADSDDALLTAYQQAAVSHLEGFDGVLARALITQTWDLSLDSFPPDAAAIRPPLGKLQSVTSITYTDTNGDSQTWAAANYTVDTATQPGRICPAYNVSYPSARYHANTVVVRFVAGYGDYGSDVPEPLRVAIGQLVAHWYENREPVITGTISSSLPMHVEALIAPYRLRWLT